MESSVPRYAHMCVLSDCTLPQAKSRVVEALKTQGFGVLTEIDVQDTLRIKLDVTFRPYVILGACNPVLAERALSIDPTIGLLLPCNVCLWEEGTDTVVAITRPDVLFGIAEHQEALESVMQEARTRLNRVAESLT